MAGFRQARTDLRNVAEAERCVVRRVVVIVHSHEDFAIIRKRANEGDRSRVECEIAARMGTPGPLHGLRLVDAIDDAHIGSAFDESRHADRDLGPAILAAQQQMRPVVGRCQRRRDQWAVVERGFLVGDDPRRIAARSALARPLARVRRGSIEAVVAFEPLAIVLDLTAGIGRVLRLRPGGEDDKSASDDQGGAHAPMRADRVSPCKAGESREPLWLKRRPVFSPIARNPAVPGAANDWF